jgi:hypothetical protein
MIMTESENIVRKFAKTMYRDNSQDDPQYSPLQDEKPFLEKSGIHATPESKRIGVLRTAVYGMVLVSLVISVTLNFMAWRDLVKLKQTPHSDEHEHHHGTYGTEKSEPSILTNLY